MKKLVALCILLGLTIQLCLSGCSLSTTEPKPTTESKKTTKSQTTLASFPEPETTVTTTISTHAETTAVEIQEKHIDPDLLIAELKKLTLVDNYVYFESEGDYVGGTFSSVTSAMLSIDLAIYFDAGPDFFENLRAEIPGEEILLDSFAWGTAIYYELDEWTSKVIALSGNDCYIVGYVPIFYPTKPMYFATALTELFVLNPKS